MGVGWDQEACVSQHVSRGGGVGQGTESWENTELPVKSELGKDWGAVFREC